MSYNVKKRAKIIEDVLDKLVPTPLTMWTYDEKSENSKLFLLIRLILSIAVRFPQAVIAYENFRKIIKKPEDVLNTKPSAIEKAIGNLNYYKNKTKHIIGLTKQYIYDLKKKLPTKYEDLMKLYGISTKVISIYLNLTQDKNLFVVDVNVLSLMRQYFPEQVKKRTSTHDIMLFGNYIFKDPRKTSYQMILYRRKYCQRWLCKKENPCPLCKHFHTHYISIHV